MSGLKRLTARGLTLDAAAVRDPAAMGSRLYELATEALSLSAPLLVVTVIAALIAPLAIGGWSFAPSAVLPKFSRISPASGFQRMLSMRGVAELGKALLKAALIGGVGVLVLWKGKDSMLELAGQPFIDGGIQSRPDERTRGGRGHERDCRCGCSAAALAVREEPADDA
jgi:flagellar biosynthetic protein FlhB